MEENLVHVPLLVQGATKEVEFFLMNSVTLGTFTSHDIN